MLNVTHTMSTSTCGSGYATLSLKNGASIVNLESSACTLAGISLIWTGIGTGQFINYGQLILTNSQDNAWSGTGLFNNFGTIQVTGSKTIGLGGTFSGTLNVGQLADSLVVVSSSSTIPFTFTSGFSMNGAGSLVLGYGTHTFNIPSISSLVLQRGSIIKSTSNTLVVTKFVVNLPSCDTYTSVIDRHEL